MRRGRHIARRENGVVKNIVLIVMGIIFLGGLVYALYPLITGAMVSRELHRVSETFILSTTEAQAQSEPLEDDSDASTDPATEEPSVILYPELLKAMQAYNEAIYTEGQAGLCDAWAYENPSFDLTEYGVEDGVIGVLSILSIDLEMPIYLGATYEHMAKGATHLSQTSLPIGGENTNCVIAGHRGWQGAPYFLYLDRTVVGDEVTITNLWETLTYRVCEIRVIEPNDIDAVLIQPGRDMLTLITCHPYASGGRYRLVIYCERVNSQ